MVSGFGCLVLPLLDATANNVVVEALACGLPVVTTDLPNAGDYLNERCSMVVPPKNPQKLAETILSLEKRPIPAQPAVGRLPRSGTQVRTRGNRPKDIPGVRGRLEQ